MAAMEVELAPVDPNRDRYPHCIVWSPIPFITWLVPVIGHMGIANRAGITFDFAGPYHISANHMAFGRTTRFLQLDPSQCQGDDWDRSVEQACEMYKGRMHNLCCDNCHSHVAVALEHMRYRGRDHWDMVTLALWVFFSGTYVSPMAVVKQWAPFLIWVTVVIVVMQLQA